MSVLGVTEVDVNIDADNIEDGARRILQTIRPDWMREEIKLKTYTEGLCNILLGCRRNKDTEDSILIRIYGKNTDLLIDREAEMLTMVILSEANCCKPLLCKFTNGISYGYMPGLCLDQETVRDEHIGTLIAKEMVRVAAIDPTEYSGNIPRDFMRQKLPKEPMVFKKMRTFLSYSPDTFPDATRNAKLKQMITSREDLKREVDLLETELSKLKSPLVFCHNDLLLNNIVFNEKDDRCYFIDYEYAAFNYQAFDIANHFCEWAGINEVDYSLLPNRAEQLRWLKHYQEAYNAQQGREITDVSSEDLEKLYVQVNKFALAAHLFWGLWGLVQAKYSTIDFDYLEYARIRFAEYFTKKKEYLALELPA